MRLSPTLAQILVRVLPSDTERTLESGLVVPDNARSDYLRGEILAVGPKVQSGEIQAGRVLRWRERTGVAMRHQNITFPGIEGSPPVRSAPGRRPNATAADMGDLRIVNEESALAVELDDPPESSRT